MDNQDYFASPRPATPNGFSPPPDVTGTTTITAQERELLANATETSWEHITGASSSYSPSAKLGFFGSIHVGSRLVSVCWRVIAEEPGLLCIPVIVLAVSGLAVVGYADVFHGIDNLVSNNKYVTAVHVFPLLAFVLTANVVGQAVIVAAATARLNGGYLSLGGAWARAGIQLPRLILFGVVYACERTFTFLLRSKQRWSPATIAANLIDHAWDFATFLAIPVLLYEDLPVFKSIERSGRLVAKRWGVQLTANAVINIAIFFYSLPLFVLAFIVLAAYSIPVGLALFAAIAIGQSVVAATLTGVLSAALYRFATTGAVAPGFSESEMWSVFSRR